MLPTTHSPVLMPTPMWIAWKGRSSAAASAASSRLMRSS
jgi:hypothetical protein